MYYEIVLDKEKLNDYKKGRISGMIYVLSGKPYKAFAWARKKDDTHYYAVTKCTEEQFKEIVDTIEDVYPGVIIKAEKIKTE